MVSRSVLPLMLLWPFLPPNPLLLVTPLMAVDHMPSCSHIKHEHISRKPNRQLLQYLVAVGARSQCSMHFHAPAVHAVRDKIITSAVKDRLQSTDYMTAIGRLYTVITMYPDITNF